MSGDVEQGENRGNPLAWIAYGVLIGVICGAVASAVPSWFTVEVAKLQNDATADRYKTSREDRIDFNRRMDKRLADLNTTVLTACKAK